jgi:dinuclear metal center YbgI/SA1388 family protein
MTHERTRKRASESPIGAVAAGTNFVYTAPMTLKELDAWMRKLLPFEIVEEIDPSLNGIQVARRGQDITRVAFCVDASRESIRRAALWKADALVVHHGILWSRPTPLTRAHYERVRLLVEADMALYAVHLPLDMHPEVGNNAGIARHLGLQEITPFGPYKGVLVGVKGILTTPLTVQEAAAKLTGGDAASARFLPFGLPTISTVGIMSGDGADNCADAIAQGLDLFVTGETSHLLYHDCLEAGIHAIFAGHYYSETFGVRLLRDAFLKDTGLETQFIDLPTGM